MNNKHGIRLGFPTLSALVFSLALAGVAEEVSAQRRGDYETARREYLEAAQDGNSNAQNNLARLYRQGLGGPVDMKQAVYWFSKAAQAGQVSAETSLGDMYETGDAGAVDLSAAVSWYNRAAVSGFFIAQLSLGQMREAGRGVPQDAVIALAWYMLAARADVSPASGYFLAEHAKAVAARDSLSARLSSDQRATAENLANRWKSGYDMEQLKLASLDNRDDSLATQVTAIHSTLQSTCSADNWPARCAALATLDETARSLLDRVHAGRLSEEEGKRQLKDAREQEKQAEAEQQQRDRELQRAVEAAQGKQPSRRAGCRRTKAGRQQDRGTYGDPPNLAARTGTARKPD